jgi:AraC-like DNA-binding protein
MPVLDSSTFQKLCDARDRLRSTEEPAPTVREIAGSLSMSEFRFIRAFTALFGETPHQLRTKSRLDRAKVQLALRDESVTEVSLDAGFSSLGSFSDLFSRRVGLAPSSFRTKVRSRMTSRHELPKDMTTDCLALMVGPRK